MPDICNQKKPFTAWACSSVSLRLYLSCTALTSAFLYLTKVSSYSL